MVGLVKSPLPTTVIQVFSRVIILWGIAWAFPAVRGHWSFSTMVISWAITEVVRYTYYAVTGDKPYILTWLRYSLFFVLYITGAGSEWILAYQTVDIMQPPYLYALYALLFLYIPRTTIIVVVVVFLIISAADAVFPVQYLHMISQRKKYLNPRKDGSKSH